MTRPEDTRFGRCEATAKSSGKRCGRAATGPHGKCDIHGGKSEKGEDHPQFKHGLFSDYLSEEDRETIKILEEYGSAEKLEELINWRLARLRRAVRALNDQTDDETFWDAFREIVHSSGPIGSEEIRELAGMLAKGNSAMQREVDLLRKLIKDYEAITEGEKVRVEGDISHEHGGAADKPPLQIAFEPTPLEEPDTDD